MPNELKGFILFSLYKATRDGFSSKNFHEKVDYYPNTLTIITSEHNLRFGAFTPIEFTSSNEFKADNSMKTFLFSLSKQTKFALKSSHYDNTIYDCSTYGPVFGGGNSKGNDIQISSNADKNTNSYTNLLNSFENNYINMSYNTEYAKSYLAGSYSFKVKEVEVFQVLK